MIEIDDHLVQLAYLTLKLLSGFCQQIFSNDNVKANERKY